jgi:hypothetical protein
MFGSVIVMIGSLIVIGLNSLVIAAMSAGFRILALPETESGDATEPALPFPSRY